MQLELLALREKGGPLAALSEQEILDLAAGAKELHCTPGHIVMEAGEVGDHGCLVLQDRLVAGRLAPDHRRQHRAHIDKRPGDPSHRMIAQHTIG